MNTFCDYTNVSDFALAVDVGKPLEQLSEMLNLGILKLGYIGGTLIETIPREDCRKAEPVETNMPSFPQGMKIESELMGNHESESLMMAISKTHCGYRGALVVDTLIQQAYDAAVSTDSTASVQVPDGSYVTRAVVQTAIATIRGKNGRPFAGGRMRGIMHRETVHVKSGYIGGSPEDRVIPREGWRKPEPVETNTPDAEKSVMIESELAGNRKSAPVVTRDAKTKLPYILSDLANDLTANGVLDTEKYTREGQKWIEAGLAEDNEIVPVAGVNAAPFNGDVEC